MSSALMLVGCSSAQATSVPRVASPQAMPTPPACPAPWGCEQQERFGAVEAYLEQKVGVQGFLGVVFSDRSTGATWRSGATDHAGWTASTIKLAMAADMLARDRVGTISLSAADHRDVDTMLNFSDNAATDRLWEQFGGDAMLARFRSELGMGGLHFVPGFTRSTYWGFLKCTTDDLAALMQHVLTRSDPADRAYLVAAMRGVAPNQQWGVWAAGAAQQPGNKDGWSEESDPYGKHWVTDTVGFAGPDERFVVAIMYQVAPGGSLADGVHAVSDIAALLFGAPVPASITVPEPDG